MREIVDLRLTFLVVGDWVEHGGFFRENLDILDEVLPLDRVQLLKVLRGRNMGVLVLFANDLSERQNSLKSK